MRRLRFSILTLVVTLAFFLKIERLRFEEDAQLIDVQRFVYVLGIIILIVMLGLPIFRRIPVYFSLIGWIALYFPLKLLVFSSPTHPLLGDYHTFVSLTEVGFLAILVLLADILSHSLYDFEQAIENITFSKIGKRIKRISEAEADIQAEFIRSRRHQHPMTVIVVDPDPTSVQTTLHRMVREIQQAMIGRYVLTSLARTISKALRRTDIVLEQTEHDRFVIVCPETDAKASSVLVDRMRMIAEEQLGISISCGIGSFPKEAVTFEELLRQAESKLISPPRTSNVVEPPIITKNDDR